MRALSSWQPQTVWIYLTLLSCVRDVSTERLLVGRPDVGGREEILGVHARKKPLAEDLDLKQIAQTTAGFTGADLENLMNEAAIRAAGENREYNHTG